MSKTESNTILRPPDLPMCHNGVSLGNVKSHFVNIGPSISSYFLEIEIVRSRIAFYKDLEIYLFDIEICFFQSVTSLRVMQPILTWATIRICYHNISVYSWKINSCSIFFNSVNVTYYRRLDVNRYLVISRNPLQLALQPARKGSDRVPFYYQAKLFRLEQNISKGIVDLTETYLKTFWIFCVQGSFSQPGLIIPNKGR